MCTHPNIQPYTAGCHQSVAGDRGGDIQVSQKHNQLIIHQTTTTTSTTTNNVNVNNNNDNDNTNIHNNIS